MAQDLAEIIKEHKKAIEKLTAQLKEWEPEARRLEEKLEALKQKIETAQKERQEKMDQAERIGNELKELTEGDKKK